MADKIKNTISDDTTKTVASKKKSIADLANEEELNRFREEIAKLKQQINQKPKPPEFDVAKALKTVSTPLLKHVASELDKAEDKQARFNELKKQLPNMIRSNNYSNNFIGDALEKKNLSQQVPAKEMTPFEEACAEIERNYSPEEQIMLNVQLKNMLDSMQTPVSDILGKTKLGSLLKK